MTGRTARFGLLLAAALFAAAPVVAEPAAPPAEQVTLTVPQLQMAAMRAVQLGQYALAAKLAEMLIRVDPEDSYAHFVLAQAHLRGGDARLAGTEARKSFRYAQTPVQKHEAARLTAAALARQGRYFPAQIWMRRALAFAPSEQMETRAGNEFRMVRRQSRVNLNFGFSLAPSSNVNGGASDEISTVDGLPIVGLLSPSAQALSGTVARGEAVLGYRLHQDARSRTELRMASSAKWVWLSDAAQDKAPDVEDGDYSSASFEFGLTRRQALPGVKTVLSLGANLGRAWYGGETNYDYGRTTLSLLQPVGPRTALSIGVMRQAQWAGEATTQDVTTTGLNLGMVHSLENDSRLSLILQFSEATSDNHQARRESRGLRLGYAPGKPVGPVSLELGLSAFENRYPDYAVLLPVPGGREDRFWGADLDVSFDKLDYAGFVPTLRLSAQTNDSNVSRFETEEFSVTVGFKSRF